MRPRTCSGRAATASRTARRSPAPRQPRSTPGGSTRRRRRSRRRSKRAALRSTRRSSTNWPRCCGSVIGRTPGTAITPFPAAC
ncbi:hypothetical protein GBZ26_04075 [Azospirillum formosense]|uniref:Uncharacterized protein n=1 Tax=Azospirillum formosense TaxID=861533 RepID=A0ABX2KRT3_9PROT|nr:hypothetical protein [Azospirillum formosense]